MKTWTPHKDILELIEEKKKEGLQMARWDEAQPSDLATAIDDADDLTSSSNPVRPPRGIHPDVVSLIREREASELQGELIKSQWGEGSLTEQMFKPETSMIDVGGEQVEIDNRLQSRWGPAAGRAQMVEAPAGLVEKGTADLRKIDRETPASSIDTMVTQGKDGFYLLPTMTADGTKLTKDQALGSFQETGYHLGKFENAKAAQDYGKLLANTIGKANLSEDEKEFMARVTPRISSLEMARAIREADEVKEAADKLYQETTSLPGKIFDKTIDMAKQFYAGGAGAINTYTLGLTSVLWDATVGAAGDYFYGEDFNELANARVEDILSARYGVDVDARSKMHKTFNPFDWGYRYVQQSLASLGKEDPDFLDRVASGLGSMFGFFGVGLATAMALGPVSAAPVVGQAATGLTRILPKTIVEGMRARAQLMGTEALSDWMIASGAGLSEGLVEGVDVYYQRKDAGAGRIDAATAALWTVALNAPLAILVDKFGILGENKYLNSMLLQAADKMGLVSRFGLDVVTNSVRLIGKTLNSAFSEAGQETGQSLISQKFGTRKPWEEVLAPENIWETFKEEGAPALVSAPIGAMVMGGMRGGDSPAFRQGLREQLTEKHGPNKWLKPLPPEVAAGSILEKAQYLQSQMEGKPPIDFSDPAIREYLGLGKEAPVAEPPAPESKTTAAEEGAAPEKSRVLSKGAQSLWDKLGYAESADDIPTILKGAKSKVINEIASALGIEMPEGATLGKQKEVLTGALTRRMEPPDDSNIVETSESAKPEIPAEEAARETAPAIETETEVKEATVVEAEERAATIEEKAASVKEENSPAVEAEETPTQEPRKKGRTSEEIAGIVSSMEDMTKEQLLNLAEELGEAGSKVRKSHTKGKIKELITEGLKAQQEKESIPPTSPATQSLDRIVRELKGLKQKQLLEAAKALNVKREGSDSPNSLRDKIAAEVDGKPDAINYLASIMKNQDLLDLARELKEQGKKDDGSPKYRSTGEVVEQEAAGEAAEPPVDRTGEFTEEASAERTAAEAIVEKTPEKQVVKLPQRKKMTEAERAHALEMNKRITFGNLKRAFKGMKVLNLGSGIFQVDLKNGKKLYLTLVDKITANQEAFREGYGRELQKGELVAGVYDRLNDGNGLIQIAADMTMTADNVKRLFLEVANGKFRGSKRSLENTFSVFHESFHAAYDMLLSDKEKGVLISKFKSEEAAADAYMGMAGRKMEGSAVGKIFQKLRMTFNGVRAHLLGPNADSIFKELEGGKIWERVAREVSDTDSAYRAKKANDIASIADLDDVASARYFDDADFEDVIGSGASYADIIKKGEIIATAELIPSESVGAEITNASDELRLEYTNEFVKMLLDSNGRGYVAQKLGIFVNSFDIGAGGYEGGMAPNVILRIIPTKVRDLKADGTPARTLSHNVDLARLYAGIHQYIGRQDAVPFMRPDYLPLTQAEAKKAEFAVRESTPIEFTKDGERVYKERTARRFESQEDAEAYIEDLTKKRQEEYNKTITKLEEAVEKANPGRDKTKAQEKLDFFRALGPKQVSLSGLSYATGYNFRFNKELTKESREAVFQIIMEKVDPGMGFTQMAPREFVIANFLDDTGVPYLMTNEELHRRVSIAAEEMRKQGLDLRDAVKFHSEGEYGYVHDWEADPEGDELLARLNKMGLEGRPDLQAWVVDRFQEGRRLTEEFSERAREERIRKGEREPAGDGEQLVQSRYRTGGEDRQEGRINKRGIEVFMGPDGKERPFRVGKDGKVRLYHWGREKGMTVLDPGYHGTGIKGGEGERKASLPEHYVNRLYFAPEDGGYWKEYKLSNNKYEATVSIEELYDFHGDPDDLYLKAKEAIGTGNTRDTITLYEKLIKEAGYKGAWYDLRRGEYDTKDTLAIIFDPIDVESIPYTKYPNDLEAEGTDSKYRARADSEYLEAVEDGDMETAQRMVDEAAKASGLPILDDSAAEAYKIRRSKAPGKTVKAYKLFATKKGQPGKIFPLFVGAKDSIPMGVWLDAQEGPVAPDSKTGKRQVKSKLGSLAFRPGWHAGDLPLATHIGVKDSGGNIIARRASEVWVEVEMAADVDYQPEATANGTSENGRFSPALADIKKMPENGMYRYKTNPNMTGDWIISGAMKINRVLTESEVANLLKAEGIDPMPWDGGKLILEKMGLNPELAKNIGKLTDTITYDDQGNIIPLSRRFNADLPDTRYRVVSHGSAAHFDQFELSKIGTGEGNQAFGWGLYFTDREGIAETYRASHAGKHGNIGAQINGDKIYRNKRTDGWAYAGEKAGKKLEQHEGLVADILYNAEILSLAAPELNPIELPSHEVDPEALKAAIDAWANGKMPKIPKTPITKLSRREVRGPIEKFIEKAKAFADGIESFNYRDDEGQVYKVDIPEADLYLNFDEGIDEQPKDIREKVLSALLGKQSPLYEYMTDGGRELVDKYMPKGNPDLDSMLEAYSKAKDRADEKVGEYFAKLPDLPELARHNDANQDVERKFDEWTSTSGSLAYPVSILKGLTTGASMGRFVGGLSRLMGSDKAASLYLGSIGIPGLRYLDGSSRSRGEGTYNYVVWDDSQVKILDTKYRVVQGMDKSDAPITASDLKKGITGGQVIGIDKNKTLIKLSNGENLILTNNQRIPAGVPLKVEELINVYKGGVLDSDRTMAMDAGEYVQIVKQGSEEGFNDPGTFDRGAKIALSKADANALDVIFGGSESQMNSFNEYLVTGEVIDPNAKPIFKKMQQFYEKAAGGAKIETSPESKYRSARGVKQSDAWKKSVEGLELDDVIAPPRKNQSFREKWEATKRWWKTQMTDDLWAIKEYMGKDIYELATTAIRGAGSRAEGLIRFGEESKGVKSLHEIFAQIKPDENDGFMHYVVYKHLKDIAESSEWASNEAAGLLELAAEAKEEAKRLRKAGDQEGYTNEMGRATLYMDEHERLQKQIKETKAKAADYTQAIKSLEAQFPHWKGAQKELTKFNRYLLWRLKDSGVISNPLHETLVNRYPNYVPLQRDMSDLFDSGVDAMTSTKGVVNILSPIYNLKGSMRDVVDPLFQIVSNVYSFESIYGKQKVALEIAKAEAKGELEGIVERTKEKRSDPKRGEYVFHIWENGKKKFYKTDKDLYIALTQPEPGWKDNKILKVLSVPTRMLRTGVVTSVRFLLRNVARDTVNAGVMAEHFVPFLDSVKGLFNVMGHTQLYQDFVKDGGLQGFTYMDPKSKEQIVLGIRAGQGGNRMLGYAKRPISSLGLFFDQLGQLSELSTRVGLYKKSLEAGMSREQATFVQRDLLDFSRGGDTSRLISRFNPFFNAQYQGVNKLLRSFYHDGKVDAKTIGRALLYVTLPSMLATAWNYSDDDRKKKYLDIPQWRKNLFWNMVIGEGDDAWVLSIPKPFELGIIFGSIPERVMDYSYAKDRRAFDQLATSLVEAVSPETIPLFVGLPMEIMGNYSVFYDKPIVPMGEEKLPAKLQFGAFTSEWAKWAGEWFGLSPRKLEYAVFALTGNAGMEYGELIDAALKRVSGVTRPEKAWYQTVPGPSAFAMSAKALHRTKMDFRSDRDELTSMLAGAKRVAASKGTKALNKKERNALRMESRIQSVDRMFTSKGGINAIQREIQEITMHKSLTSEQKTRKVDVLEKKIARISQRGIRETERLLKMLDS